MRVALLAVAAVAVEATQTVYTIPDKCARARRARARDGLAALSATLFTSFHANRDAFGASYAQFAAACMVLGAAFIVLAVLSKTYCWLVRPRSSLGYRPRARPLSHDPSTICRSRSARSRCGRSARALKAWSGCAGARNLR